MDLSSTIVTVKNLLLLNFSGEFAAFIIPSHKDHLSIPVYQREYKWIKQKIKTFIDNIMQRSKFLGILTVEATNGADLVIVDGQQRITTIFLFLAALYNACAEEGETETQDEIRELITYRTGGQVCIKLVNESLDVFLHFQEQDGKQAIALAIDPDKDVYKQAKSFETAYEVIRQALVDRDRNITLDTYKQQLLDCKVLLFGQKNVVETQQGSSEEIYIDINEKIQSLEPEDIFKGHCFAICKTRESQDKVKDHWHSLKKRFFQISRLFPKVDLSVLLHYYLLIQEGTKQHRQDIKKSLTIEDESVVTRRYNTPTKVVKLLEDIDLFLENLLSYEHALTHSGYDFAALMNASAQTVGNNRDRLSEAVTMLQSINTCNQNLFKLPLYFFVDTYSRKPQEEKLSYQRVTGFVYLYYIYMFLFSKVGGKRSREHLPNNLIRRIHEGEGINIAFIREIGSHAGNYFDLSGKIKNRKVAGQLYEILDYLEVSAATAPATCDDDLNLKLQLFPNNYNLEHLIIPRSKKIEWKSPDGTPYSFNSDDFEECECWSSVKNNNWTNFIRLDKDYNRDELGNKDIVTKIGLLRGTTAVANPPAPASYAARHRHIELFCQHIINTSGYPELLTAYNNNETRENVLDRYRTFFNNYFDPEWMQVLCNELEAAFKGKIASLMQLVQ